MQNSINYILKFYMCFLVPDDSSSKIRIETVWLIQFMLNLKKIYYTDQMMCPYFVMLSNMEMPKN